MAKDKQRNGGKAVMTVGSNKKNKNLSLQLLDSWLLHRMISRIGDWGFISSSLSPYCAKKVMLKSTPFMSEVKLIWGNWTVSEGSFYTVSSGYMNFPTLNHKVRDYKYLAYIIIE